MCIRDRSPAGGVGGVEGDGLVDITTIQMPEICVTTALSHQIFITTLEGPLQILEVHVLGMISATSM